MHSIYEVVSQKQDSQLHLIVEQPIKDFSIKSATLVTESTENEKAQILKQISIIIPSHNEKEINVHIRMQVSTR